MKMIGKQFLKILAAIMLLAAGAWTASAQGKVETKQYKLQDLQQKITKVVMTGNDFKDGAFRQDVVAHWHINPFEFCTLEEFGQLSKKSDYYFLVITTGQFEGEIEPGIDFLTLVKGGPEAEDGIDGMFEVVSVPFGIPGGTGREIAMLPALLDIIQDFTLKAQESDAKGYKGLRLYNANLRKVKGRTVLFAESDLSLEVTALDREDLGLRCVEDDDADDAMIASKEGTVVSYTVAPEQPSSTSRCYKMLIDAENHTLYYFDRHRISGKTGTGFTRSEVCKIAKMAQ